MNVQEPYRCTSINFENIIYKKIKSKYVKQHKKIIYLKYKDGEKNNNFVIQLSKTHGNNVITNNEIEFEVNDKLITFFNTLDDSIINEAKNNSQTWFDHIVDTSSINYQRVLNVNNTIKLKFINNNEFTTKCFINEHEIDSFSDIPTHNTTNKIILECYAVWVKSDSFGLLLRPVTISLSYVEKQIYNYKFLNDSDNESECLSENDNEYLTENENDLQIFCKNNISELLNIQMQSDTTSSSDFNINLNNLLLS